MTAKVAVLIIHGMGSQEKDFGEPTKAEINELVDLAERRSPVYDIVTNPVPVSINLERM